MGDYGGLPYSPRRKMQTSEPMQLPLAEIPRGSVPTKVAFFEGLVEKQKSPRGGIEEQQVFKFNRMSKVVEVDTPAHSEEGDEDVLPDDSSHCTPSSLHIPKPGFTRISTFFKPSSGDSAAGLTPPPPHEPDMDAICINCQEYISIQDMDDHSLMCVSVLISPTTLHEENIVKIRKLHRGINRRIKNATGERLAFLLRMREIAVQITKKENSPLASFYQELQELAVNALGVKGGISCAIFARRLAMLISEKELLLYSKDENQPTEALPEPADWKGKTGMVSVLSEVRSNTSKSSLPVSSSRISLVDEIADLRIVDEIIELGNEEQMRKYFYSICLKQKLLLPKGHPKQRALVSKMYEEAKRQELAPVDWERFIAEYLTREDD